MIGDTFINVEGAYGRKYSDIDSAKKDWAAGKDFRIQVGGSYININDWEVYAPHKRVTLYLGAGRYETLQEGR